MNRKKLPPKKYKTNRQTKKKNNSLWKNLITRKACGYEKKKKFCKPKPKSVATKTGNHALFELLCDDETGDSQLHGRVCG